MLLIRRWRYPERHFSCLPVAAVWAVLSEREIIERYYSGKRKLKKAKDSQLRLVAGNFPKALVEGGISDFRSTSTQGLYNTILLPILHESFGFLIF